MNKLIEDVTVFVCGEYRQFELAVKTWKPLIDSNCHFIVSMWNTSHQYNKNLNIDYFDNIHDSMISEYLPNSTIKLWDEYLIHEGEMKNKTKNYKMLFHWLAAIEMYESSNLNLPSRILLIRPDLYLSGLENLDKMSTGTWEMYTPGGPSFMWDNKSNQYTVSTQDTHFFTEFDNLKKMVNSIDKREDRECSHPFIAEEIINNNLRWKHSKINDLIIRPQARKQTKPLRIDDVVSYHKQWSETHKETDIIELDKKFLLK